MALMPRESAKFIAHHAKNVFIEEAGVKNLAYAILEGLKSRKISVDNFSQNTLHPSPKDPKAVDWIFVLDTLNYSFWAKQGSPKWTVNGQSGYFALCAAVKRAMEEGKPIVDPKYYSQITRSDAERIFRGDNAASIPMLDERVKCLREAGQVLLNDYEGSFENYIKTHARSTGLLLKCIVNDFKSYQDEALYEGLRVSFYKRAQILIGDIWACFKGQGIGDFHGIDQITMFADYRIPQVLVHFGAIGYNNTLLRILQYELENGSDEEVEIRGCSIEAIERVKDEVRDLIDHNPNLGLKKSDINAILIDHFLWDYRREHAQELESIPFHKTRCIYY